MNHLLVVATGMTILLSMLNSYRKHRDPLSPMIIFGVMLLFTYVWTPGVLIQTGAIDPFFEKPSDLSYVLLINLAAVLAFCLGASSGKLPRGARGGLADFRIVINATTQRRLRLTGLLCALLAGGVFFYLVEYTGGWVRVYSTR